MEQQLRDKIAEFTSVIGCKDAEIQRLQSEIATVTVQLKELHTLVEKNNVLSLKNLTAAKEIWTRYEQIKSRCEKDPAIMNVLCALLKPEEQSPTLEETIKSDYQ